MESSAPAEHFPPPWSRLDENHARAKRFPLDILVWGPASDDSLEYRKREEIRDALTAAGHNAAFSEDLMPAGEAVHDPLEEELMQVDAAHLVVVLYGSRGVQTEVDTLLDLPRFAEKAIVFIRDDVHEKVKTSVSRAIWERLNRYATAVIEYTTEELEQCLVVEKANERAQLARQAAFVATLRQAAGGR